MKYRVKLEIADRCVDEVVEAPDAESFLAGAKERVAKELGWKGMFLKVMSPLAFAQLAVKMYNENFGTNHAIPENAEQFIEFGKQTGNLEVVTP